MESSRRHAAPRAGGRAAGGRTARRWLFAAALTGLGLTAVAAAVTAVAVVVARMVLVPPTSREEDTEVLGVDREAGTVTFGRSLDSVVAGRYSFWFDAARGHARVGEILAETADSVTRELLAVDVGDLASAERGRFNGWFYRYPDDVAPEDPGFTVQDVVIDTELGPAPAWLIPASDEDAADGDWVIQVHGRAVMRAETIRAIPVFRDAGYTSLLISYRNDFEAPPSADGRYALGDTEWRDVDAAIDYAIRNGARSIVLMGWSMGGATVLQALTRSARADVVRGLVLDSPVIDWVTALDYQGRSMGFRGPLRSLVYAMMGAAWGRPFTGQRESIDLARLDFVRRADELTVPVLILHSDDDGYVPSSASHALAAARPDIVTLEVFDTARHTKLWNYDPQRWNGAIAAWLARLSP